ncbi:MAG: hypothetical protein QW335_05085 [Candidatus Nezhaarchaeales archaeon]
MVKNMRGVVVFDPAEDVSQDLKWLTNRFKYRILGISPSLAKNLTKVVKPLVPLAYPHREVMDFVDFTSRTLNLEYGIAEAICLASCYVSPLLALGSRAQSFMREVAVSEVTSKIEIGLKDWKLHLRIADYSVLDLYEWSTTQAQKLWFDDVSIEEVMSERATAIKRDERRYWRLQRGSLEPRTFLVYLDLIQSLYKKGLDPKSITKYDKNVISACLAINVSVFIKPC